MIKEKGERRIIAHPLGLVFLSAEGQNRTSDTWAVKKPLYLQSLILSTQICYTAMCVSLSNPPQGGQTPPTFIESSQKFVNTRKKPQIPGRPNVAKGFRLAKKYEKNSPRPGANWRGNQTLIAFAPAIEKIDEKQTLCRKSLTN
jgi:hypothetical protein